MQDLKITIIQTKLVWEDKGANLKNIEELIKDIKETDLIVLPEMFNTAFSMKPEIFSEEVEGSTFQWMKKMAVNSNAAIAGSFMVKENSNYYNRFYVVSPDGRYKVYNKRHLFRMGNEHLHYTAGDKELIFELKGWKIKALICYDLRFPVFSKNNYNEGSYDYDALIYVANWPAARNHIWKGLLYARALENQSYIIGVNRIGEDVNGYDHAGSSSIISPKGEYIIDKEKGCEFVETAVLSYDELQNFRESFTVGLDWDSFEIKD